MECVDFETRNELQSQEMARIICQTELFAAIPHEAMVSSLCQSLQFKLHFHGITIPPNQSPAITASFDYYNETLNQQAQLESQNSSIVSVTHIITECRSYSTEHLSLEMQKGPYREIGLRIPDGLFKVNN